MESMELGLGTGRFLTSPQESQVNDQVQGVKPILKYFLIITPNLMTLAFRLVQVCQLVDQMRLIF